MKRSGDALVNALIIRVHLQFYQALPISARSCFLSRNRNGLLPDQIANRNEQVLVVQSSIWKQGDQTRSGIRSIWNAQQNPEGK